MFDLVEKLPSWLRGTEAAKLARAARAFFQRWEDWVNEAKALVDFAAAPADALDLHGWGLLLERLPDEPDALWRERVRHAVENHQLGGVRKGLDAALTFYGVTGAAVIERDPLFGDDTIRIEMDANAFDPLILEKVIRERGRACRRYVVGDVSQASVFMGVIGSGLAFGNATAADPGGPLQTPRTPAEFFIAAITFGHVHSTSIAS